jgi:Cu(I)/Ag(I) efflux system membrane fusion protein
MVRIPDLPGSEWTGQIVFVSPEVNPDTRINLIRVELPNAGGLLKPGMPAYVTLTGRQGYSLTLPMAAVIQNEKSKVVWIETGHNVFRPVMVETGLEDGNQVEIRSGLKAGDMVVTSGAYLLNSEYIFRHGSDPMAGMKM